MNYDFSITMYAYSVLPSDDVACILAVLLYLNIDLKATFSVCCITFLNISY